VSFSCVFVGVGPTYRIYFGPASNSFSWQLLSIFAQRKCGSDTHNGDKRGGASLDFNREKLTNLLNG